MKHAVLKKLGGVIVAAVTFASCAPLIPGTFTGTLTQSGTQAQRATLTVAQNGDMLNGTLLSSLSGSSGGMNQNSALFSGQVFGSIFTGGFDIRNATIQGGMNNCTSVGTLRFADERITGFFAGQGNCAGQITSIDVSRNGVASPTPSNTPSQ
jgi:hypothetical protein